MEDSGPSRADLRARVVAHKQVLFPAASAAYESAAPGTFKPIPPAPRLEILAADYRAIQDMFIRSSLAWEQIVASLGQLEVRINTPASSCTV